MHSVHRFHNMTIYIFFFFKPVLITLVKSDTGSILASKPWYMLFILLSPLSQCRKKQKPNQEGKHSKFTTSSTNPDQSANYKSEKDLKDHCLLRPSEQRAEYSWIQHVGVKWPTVTSGPWNSCIATVVSATNNQKPRLTITSQPGSCFGNLLLGPVGKLKVTHNCYNKSLRASPSHR